MRCGSCGSGNPGDGRFCGACGAELTRTCPVCATENPIRFRFCGNCGSALDPAAIASPVIDESDSAPPSQGFTRRASDGATAMAPERRHLTVMFCDLVGSTALSLRMDPEELRDVVRSYQAACAAVIERYDGWVAQYLGDGVLAYFGYPVAHEDEGGRAARTGLGIVRAVQSLSRELDLPAGLELAVRIAIHTGEVVVGEVGGGARREHLALGDAPNIAARLQAIAQPNTVIASDVTRRLFDRAIEVQDLGMPALRGVDETGHVWRVIREQLAEELEPLAAGNFVGRNDELEFMQHRWNDAGEGRGQVVVLVGDPGIGKSKLVREFVRRAMFTACNRMETRCLPYYQNTPYFPFTDLLRRNLGCDPEQPAEQRLQSITQMLEREGFALEETVPLFASLMSVPLRPDAVESDEPPARLKERTRAALIRLILGAAATMPLVLVVEDLHWADPSTLELLDELVPLVASARLLVIFTARHEFELRWTGQDHVTHVGVRRLPDASVAAMIRSVTGGRELPADVVNTIVERTDGVPLFVEELTRMVLESGYLQLEGGRYELAGPLPPLAIPATLRDSLEARLDRLGRAKELAQLAATLGREFDYDLIHAVAGLPEPALRGGLERLVAAGLLIDEGVPPDAHYAFRHALIQEAAYQSLLRTTRQAHHLRTADVLTREFPATVRAQPELLAHHLTAGGQAEEAVEAWTRAGRVALQRSANAEAVGHLRQGLDLVDRIADAMQRAHAELDLLALLGPALVTTRGYASPEVQAVYARARDLAQRAARTRHLAQMLTGLFANSLVRGEFETTVRIAAELHSLASASDDDGILLAANAARGVASFTVGDLVVAAEHLDQVIAAYDPVRHGPMALSFGQDFGVVALSYSAFAFGVMGQTAKARARSAEAVASAERLTHPHSLALALALRGALHQTLQEADIVKETATRLHQLSVSQGFGHWELEALQMLSWTAGVEGRFDEAFELTAACAVAARRLDATLPHVFHQPAIIEILLLTGRPDEALRAADELLTLLRERNMRWFFEPEVIRKRGQALIALGRTVEADKAISRALEMATARDAHLIALRCAADLLELRAPGTRQERLEALIDPLLERFAHGTDDAPDVMRARGLRGNLPVLRVS